MLCCLRARRSRLINSARLKGTPSIETDRHPQVGQRRRSQQTRLVEQHAFQTQLSLVERRRRFRRRGWPGVLGRDGRRLGTWRRAVGSHPAGIQPPLLPFPRGRLVIGGAALPGTPPAMDAAAAKRATQIDPAGIAGMREKPNPAVRTISHARLQLRMRLQNGVQRRLVAEHQRSGRIVLVPIRPERERLLDRDDKKARFSVTMAILCTTSSYLIDAQASRGGARFFSCAKIKRVLPGRPKRPPASRLRQSTRRSATQLLDPRKGLLERRKAPPSSFQVVGQFS